MNNFFKWIIIIFISSFAIADGTALLCNKTNPSKVASYIVGYAAIICILSGITGLIILLYITFKDRI